MSILNPKHLCAADGCHSRIPLSRFMCHMHWDALSSPSKAAVNLAFGSWKKEPSIASVKALREAQKNAIESLRDVA